MATVRYWNTMCRDCNVFADARTFVLNRAVDRAEKHHSLTGHSVWLWEKKAVGEDHGPTWLLPAPQTGAPGLF